MTDKLELIKALFTAAKSFASLERGSKGQYGKYADLGDVLDAVEKPLADNGLRILQPIDMYGETPCLHTILLHESGQYIDSWYPLKEDTSGSKNELQAEGSGLSYQRRYAICSLLGINWGGDDDGATARRSQPSQPRPQQQAKSAPQAPPAQNAGSTPSGSLAQLQATFFSAEKELMIWMTKQQGKGVSRNEMRQDIFKTTDPATDNADILKANTKLLKQRAAEIQAEMNNDAAVEQDTQDLRHES
jgi:hypothetical protein